MKLATSTGDFSYYVESVEEKIKHFKGSKFKYINLEQSGNTAELFSKNDSDWRKVAEKWGLAAEEAGVEFVASHAPCVNVFDGDEESQTNNLRALRRSIEVCNFLGIKRTVIHSCPHKSFDKNEFFRQNKLFYEKLFDLMEKYDITVMTENWDNMNLPVSTGKELREFVDYIDHPLLSVCWDTAHGNINERARLLGQYKNIMDIGDKLKGLHISDNFGDSHHHSWPFAGIINFDSVLQGLLDVNYDGYFTFEASYTLLHSKNPPYNRKAWEKGGETITKLLNPSIELKKKSVDLLYETGKYMLETYNCFEE